MGVILEVWYGLKIPRDFTENRDTFWEFERGTWGNLGFGRRWGNWNVERERKRRFCRKPKVLRG